MRFLPVAVSEKPNKEESKRSKSVPINKKDKYEIIIDVMRWGMHRPGTMDLVINGRVEDI